jgi:microcin C transport system permease protein
MRGLTSDDFHQLSVFGKMLDYLWHIALPVTASVVGNFAIVTILTKNTFLEEISRQYVLTARAKGAPERDVLWKHVLRNAMRFRC